MQEKRALFAGSFDPFTRGHEALVEAALALFDRVIIGVGDNRNKQGLLTPDKRKALIEELYRDCDRVEVRLYRGLTTDFAREVGAAALVRGVRNSIDFVYEQTLEAANRRLAPDIRTVVLFTPPQLADISSSTVRELLVFGHPVEEWMPHSPVWKRYLAPVKEDRPLSEKETDME